MAHKDKNVSDLTEADINKVRERAVRSDDADLVEACDLALVGDTRAKFRVARAHNSHGRG